MAFIKINSSLMNTFVRNLAPLRSCNLNSVKYFSTTSVAKADWVPKEIETHTGQKWDDNDYRMARFIDKPKHVNQNFAYKLIAEIPPKQCKERVVWCDGGGGPTGHPKVYINLDKPGAHSCGYCGLRFVKEEGHH